jgi:hypothetical protein
MNSQNSNFYIPGVMTLAASFIVNNNEPALIATESFRYFSLFILLSGLSSAILILLLMFFDKHIKQAEKIAMTILSFYTLPTFAYTVIFIGASDRETLKFIMSFFN